MKTAASAGTSNQTEALKKPLSPQLLTAFERWYAGDWHSSGIDHYKDEITPENIASWPDEKFIQFFYNFAADGGKVQSGGERNKDEFKTYLENNKNNLLSFRTFVLEPFSEEFDL